MNQEEIRSVTGSLTLTVTDSSGVTQALDIEKFEVSNSIYFADGQTGAPRPTELSQGFHNEVSDPMVIDDVTWKVGSVGTRSFVELSLVALLVPNELGTCATMRDSNKPFSPREVRLMKRAFEAGEGVDFDTWLEKQEQQGG